MYETVLFTPSHLRPSPETFSSASLSLASYILEWGPDRPANSHQKKDETPGRQLGAKQVRAPEVKVLAGIRNPHTYTHTTCFRIIDILRNRCRAPPLLQSQPLRTAAPNLSSSMPRRMPQESGRMLTRTTPTLETRRTQIMTTT